MAGCLLGGMLLPDRAKGPEWNVRRRQRILEAITPREMELIRLVCSGRQYTYKSIAALMGVGRSRVDQISGDLMLKFGLEEKPSLVHFAMAWGLVPVCPWEQWLQGQDAGAAALEGEEVPCI